jgi:ubiquinone/menaquinone biosynthesis C-methylase UbiE
MDKKDRKTYWDTFESLYQMGIQKHRIYLLDLMDRLGVSSFLDVGCGTGPLYELLKTRQQIVDYKGVDYSPAMVEIAKTHFPQGDWEVEDARKLTEEDNSWDAVVLMHSLDHLDDHKSAIKEAARVAKRYVIIILWRSFVSEGTRLNNRNMYGKEEGEEPWEDTHLQEYSKSTLEDDFKEAGLTIEETAEGETLNEPGRYNFLYLLRKNK